MLKVRLGGINRTFQKMRIMRGGTLTNVRRAQYHTGTGLEVVFLGSDPLSVGISPVTITGHASDPAKASAVISGGRGPYVYQWTATSDLGHLILTGATSAAVNISALHGADAEGTVEVTVTDADGQTASAAVAVYFTNYN